MQTTGDAEIVSLNPFRYRGYVYDEETGLYYLLSRYYDPATGRYINADGLVSTGQGIGGTNMYSYCGNNPVSRADPSGNSFIAALAIGGLILAGLSGCVTATAKIVNCYSEATELVPGKLGGKSVEKSKLVGTTASEKKQLKNT